MTVRDGKEAAAAAAVGVCLHAVTKLSSCATIWSCAFVDGIHFQLRQAFISSSLILFKCNSATRNGVCIHNTAQLCAHIYFFFSFFFSFSVFFRFFPFFREGVVRVVCHTMDWLYSVCEHIIHYQYGSYILSRLLT